MGSAGRLPGERPLRRTLKEEEIVAGESGLSTGVGSMGELAAGSTGPAGVRGRAHKSRIGLLTTVTMTGRCVWRACEELCGFSHPFKCVRLLLFKGNACPSFHRNGVGFRGHYPSVWQDPEPCFLSPDRSSPMPPPSCWPHFRLWVLSLQSSLCMSPTAYGLPAVGSDTPPFSVSLHPT